jgi:hypothetical protein
LAKVSLLEEKAAGLALGIRKSIQERGGLAQA